MRKNRNAVWMAVGAIVVMFVLSLVQRVTAGTSAERTTYLTFSKSVRLPGMTLNAGTYVFEYANPFGAPGVVRVTSRDRKVAYFMAVTHAAERPDGMSLDASVSLGESTAGVPPPITVWWPIGEGTGREFIYADR